MGLSNSSKCGCIQGNRQLRCNKNLTVLCVCEILNLPYTDNYHLLYV